MKKNTTTETVVLLVPVRIEYESPSAKRYVLAQIRASLSCAIYTSDATAKTGRPRIMKDRK